MLKNAKKDKNKRKQDFKKWANFSNQVANSEPKVVPEKKAGDEI